MRSDSKTKVKVTKKSELSKRDSSFIHVSNMPIGSRNISHILNTRKHLSLQQNRV